jgi:serine/threonine protein kinase
MSYHATNSYSRPAELLVGELLDGGWKVTSLIQRGSTATGGKFSVGYLAENEKGDKAYVKALDLSEILQARNAMQELEAISRAYNFEVNICKSCQNLKNVVSIFGHGQANLAHKAPGFSQVFYLIFEKAEGDIRDIIEEEHRHDDLKWKLRVLKNVAAGLSQLHRNGITHQDLKPSNILGFSDSVFKIGDLGCASCGDGKGPRDSLTIPGDRGYAPLEMLYQVSDKLDMNDRKAADLFLLGSLFFFHFAGTSALSSLISAQNSLGHALSSNFRIDLPIWQQAFAEVLCELSGNLKSQGLPNPLIEGIVSIIRELCEPDPTKRGNKKRWNSNPSVRLLAERYESRILYLERLTWILNAQ